MKTREYFPEPTLAKFHADDSFVRGVRGPVGSGKSVAMCIEIILRAAAQRPNSFGQRKTRWAVVRNTYGELKTTSIKTWQEWIAPERCPIVFDAPIRGMVTEKLADGTTIIAEILFLALDQPKDVKKLLSLELTGAWINEAREVPKAVLDGLTGRVGRYPAKIDGGASWRGIFMDTNPPDDDHWWYKCAEEETPQGWKFYSQPPALLNHEEAGYIPNPEAENIDNHEFGYDYYLQMIPGKTGEWIKVYVMGQYGNVQDGRPIYAEYNDDIHCSKTELLPLTNLPIILAFDFGLTPSAIFAQVTPRGQFRAFDELSAERMGIDQFMRDAVMPHIKMCYEQWLDDGSIFVIGDPAGNTPGQTDEKTCFDFIKSYGFNAPGQTIPAATNSFIARREAVAGYLLRLTDGQPAFLLSPKCKMLRRGFLGGYRYRRIQVAGDERYTDTPDKNKFSHPHDALQYAALRANSGKLLYGKFKPSEHAEETNTSYLAAM